jgi:hypothetical protein
MRSHVEPKHGRKQRRITIALLHETLREIAEIERSPSNPLQGQIFVNHAFTITPIGEWAKCGSPAENVMPELCFAAYSDPVMPVQRVPQQRGPAARSADNENRAFPQHWHPALGSIYPKFEQLEVHATFIDGKPATCAAQ